jgi:hypothetical protein
MRRIEDAKSRCEHDANEDCSAQHATCSSAAPSSDTYIYLEERSIRRYWRTRQGGKPKRPKTRRSEETREGVFIGNLGHGYPAQSEESTHDTRAQRLKLDAPSAVLKNEEQPGAKNAGTDAVTTMLRCARGVDKYTQSNKFRSYVRSSLPCF